MDQNYPFAMRLKAARQAKSALSVAEGKGRYGQEKLGREAGIEEASARQRANQYETGRYLPDLKLALRFAEVLDVPLAYLFCPDEDLARLLLLAHKLTPEQRQQLERLAEELGASESSTR